MSTFVKICGMTDERAVRAAVDAGVDAVGFVFHEKSPRNISPAAAAELCTNLPDKVLKVAVTMHPAESLWHAVLEEMRPDALQTDANDFNELRVPDSVEMWPVLREGSLPATLPPLFVYEGQKSGHGQTVDWDVAADIAKRGRMILAGGLSAQNIVAAIQQVAPYGVDVSSAVESQPGVKDPDRIKAFIEAAKAA